MRMNFSGHSVILYFERLPKGWMGLSSDIGAHKITQQRALSAAHVEQAISYHGDEEGRKMRYGPMERRLCMKPPRMANATNWANAQCAQRKTHTLHASHVCMRVNNTEVKWRCGGRLKERK
ncbi:hypothetical protein PCH_Pc20g02550 [Penicillium rubens Wisconsin 54-1255]|uniref:Uncharacterized protein n=1 Tax=Penicillium rubens (strain ATCC 28089 / DSM 1075 / NRRL 1951 / Wisconsin 54-1255) TaxID=500485 RepID=B6HEH1_PENRW|nr:hypothetical protein PCH_Pc20g02550 [Penicillium rubens Wisconsin 54-1255]